MDPAWNSLCPSPSARAYARVRAPSLKKKNCLPMIVVLDAGNYGEEQRYQRLDFLYVYMNKK